MAEYIEREALLDSICYETCGIAFCGATNCAFMAKVCSAPVADVAPVVRCKDCKHYDMGVCLKIYSDGNAHPEAWQKRKPEDFCAYGERKDGADAEG